MSFIVFLFMLPFLSEKPSTKVMACHLEHSNSGDDLLQIAGKAIVLPELNPGAEIKSCKQIQGLMDVWSVEVEMGTDSDKILSHINLFLVNTRGPKAVQLYQRSLYEKRKADGMELKFKYKLKSPTKNQLVVEFEGESPQTIKLQ